MACSVQTKLEEALKEMLTLPIELPTLATSSCFPKPTCKVVAPPIKCQGIKTKLVNFIGESIRWDGKGRWVEPFLGSGTVLFNLKPTRAIVSDTNRHIIQVYNDIKRSVITPSVVSDFLYNEGERLRNSDGEYFYEVRERFNQDHKSLDFIFLTRSCFNGVMRFNKKGKFNVPFCKKPDRFRQAYITKIVNQVSWVQKILHSYDWEFCIQDWSDSLKVVEENDFVYVDPPYSGRHTDYFNQWNDEDNSKLIKKLLQLKCGFALSTWFENKYRKNCLFDVLDLEQVVLKKYDHFYHVGSSEDYRNKMIEALVISPGNAS